MPDETPQAVPATPADASQYIRTYAKDVAQLTGKPVPAPKPRPALEQSTRLAPSATEAAKNTDTPTASQSPQPLQNPVSSAVANVLLPQVDASPVDHPGGMLREAVPEVLETSKEDEQGIFTTRQAENVPPRIPQATFETETAPTPSIPPLSKPAAAARDEAVSAAYPPVPAPNPLLEQVPEPSKLHTYKSDFAERIQQQKASTFSVLAAQGDSGAPLTAAVTPRRSIAPLIIGLVLIMAGIGVVGGAYYYFKFMNRVAPAQSVPSLVAADSSVELSGSGSVLMQSLEQLANQTTTSGTLIVAYVSSTTMTNAGPIHVPASGGVLIADMNLPAPGLLLRNIDPASTVGVLATDHGSAPFFAFRVLSYDATFAGMLQWEPTMASDLALFYPAYAAPIVPVATSTASTTPAAKNVLGKKPAAQQAASSSPASPQPTVTPYFVDEVVSNHSARALKDSFGRTILIYGYADPTTLLLTRDETAFTALLARLTTPQK